MEGCSKIILNRKLYGTAAKTSLPLLLAAVLLIPSASAVYPVDPVNTNAGDRFATTSTSTPEHFVEINLQNAGFEYDGDNISFYTKGATSSSFTKRGVVEGEEEYDSNLQSYILGDNPDSTTQKEYNLNTDGQDNDKSTTVTINGNEHIFELHWVNETSNSDDISLSVDGNQRVVEEGQYVTVDGQEVWMKRGSSSTDDFFDFQVLNAYEFSSGNIDILFTVGDQSEKIKYSTRVFYATNGNTREPGLIIPQANNTNLTGFETYSVTTGTSTSGTLLTRSTNDDWNVSLRRASDDNIFFFNGKVPGNLVVESLRTDLAENALYLLDIRTEEKADLQFSPASNGYLDQSNTQYDFYYSIEDPTEARRTETFTVSTTGSNKAPEIQALQGDNGTTWKNITQFTDYNETLNEVRVEVNDDDFVYGNLSLSASYCGNVYFNESNQVRVEDPYYYWNITSSNQKRIINSGNWTVSVNITDGVSTDNRTYNWEIPWANSSNLNYQLQVNGSQGEVDLEQGNVTFWNSSISSPNGNQISATCDNTTHTLDPVSAGDSSTVLARLSEWIESIGGVVL